MEKRIILAEENADRLDIYLAEQLDVTRSYIKKLIDDKLITVEGEPVKAGREIKIGDIIDITFPQEVSDLEPQNIPLDIVYEDDSLAVINKPQGMVVHPASGVYKDTLVNALLYHFSTLSNVNGAIRPGIVHRLDKDTSGLLVVAKTDFAHNSLALQIGQKTAKRKYKALLEGVLKQDSGEITANIARDTKDRKKFVAVATGGKTALTRYKVLTRYAERTLAEFELGTGRTHQIRVHAKYIGHPIVGDKVYGFKNQAYNLNGQLLHSYSLSFTHPVTQKLMNFEIELPQYFLDVLQKQRSSVLQ